MSQSKLHRAAAYHPKKRYTFKTFRASRNNSKKSLNKSNLNHYGQRSPESRKLSENLQKIIVLRIMKRFKPQQKTSSLEHQILDWIDLYKNNKTHKGPILFTESMISQCVRDIQTRDSSANVSIPALQNIRHKSQKRDGKRAMMHTLNSSQRSVDMKEKHPMNLDRSLKTLSYQHGSFRERSFQKVSSRIKRMIPEINSSSNRKEAGLHTGIPHLRNRTDHNSSLRREHRNSASNDLNSLDIKRSLHQKEFRKMVLNDLAESSNLKETMLLNERLEDERLAKQYKMEHEKDLKTQNWLKIETFR
ncbi:unnamed protein product [Moneuplotes crassus]|uniref:Uncharacterized protein n=1 Tax=Euplotes crassus TaxID=5936 RepID=A0AAD1U5G8_EUPCR|nr:unnamed protein product [Moneuplotes crassus]